jgi:chemotaxis protein CheC
MLTGKQTDALVELVNIAFSRTAASLSTLTKQRVLLDVPEISVLPTTELTTALSSYIEGEMAAVYQLFTGRVSGNALLVLSHDGAIRLADLLTDEHPPAQRLDASAREVLVEVGNILLNACLSMFGDLLQVRFTFSTPQLYLDGLYRILGTLIDQEKGLGHALVVYTTFRLRGDEIDGYLIIVLGMASMERLIRAVAAWEQRTTGE